MSQYCVPGFCVGTVLLGHVCWLLLDTYVYQVCFLADNEVQLIRNSRRRFLSFSKHASVIEIEIENTILFQIKVLPKKI